MSQFFIISNEYQLKQAQQNITALFNKFGWLKLTPSTKKRKISKNSLSHVWYDEISKQRLDETATYYRHYCKLHFGVPIMRRDSEAFREVYDRLIKPLDYEAKLNAMFMIQVTSLMDEKQMTEYLDQMQRHFADKGVVLSSSKEVGGS